MLPKRNRLKKKKDFEKVFKNGKGFREDFLILKIVSNNLKNTRFGFIVSRKVSKKATQRNKIKRRLRELVKLKMPEMKKTAKAESRQKREIDGVLIGIPGLETKDFYEMEEGINKLFKKAKLIQ